ncbi:apolipoprotein N-acyltransferase [Aldersonia sp. NBC_00410]|uniref:apolipoprotein N-acyltransferase n=1 Tax=Aldersonia sp. NBC_00410 TaxID=2975954 RepID=UPI002252BACE|nr:apolipoprotein N-acyltransferase [Aldersonia sp. NBC_00410]MCX5045795.1 apolipoprotein N-acyltransferase [Aldersonia sp. NBC_00410]
MPRRAVLVNLALAVGGGLLLFAGFPPRPLWFFAPVGIAALTIALRSGGSLRGGFGYGMCAGLAFFVPLLPWVGEYVGPVPWLALATACAGYVGLFGVGARVVAGLPGAPVWIAAVWSLTEWARSNFPFGGFPWGRLSFGQADGVLLPIASLGGAPLLSFAVALTGTGLAALAVALLQRRTRALVGALVACLVFPLLGAALLPSLPDMNSSDRFVTVAAIQGSVPRLGLDFNAQRRAVLDNHVRETQRLADDVRAGRVPRPDIVVWPENSSDIDPLRNPDADEEITAVSEAVGAPILVGAVLVNADRTTTNSMIVWNGADGPADRHDKRIIQPFGEYLPWRGFFRHFSSYADRAGHFVAGDGNGLVHIGGVPVGVATCYEVAFDRAFRSSVRAGAELLAVPTNNATFGDSEMTYQQLAMSRVRAVEHGRAVVVAATSGVSAIIGPDGSIQQESALFIPQTLVTQVPLRTGTTLATRLGSIPEVLICLAAAAALVVGGTLRRSGRGSEPAGNAERLGNAHREDLDDIGE